MHAFPDSARSDTMGKMVLARIVALLATLAIVSIAGGMFSSAAHAHAGHSHAAVQASTSELSEVNREGTALQQGGVTVLPTAPETSGTSTACTGTCCQPGTCCASALAQSIEGPYSEPQCTSIRFAHEPRAPDQVPEALPEPPKSLV
jgi:hypothetical protein